MEGFNPSFEVLKKFLETPSRRYLFGATPYARDIISVISVQGIIDDYSPFTEFYGVPIVRTSSAPTDALVVSTTLGRPLTARRALSQVGLANCDYFMFHRYGGVNLPPARFWTGVNADVVENSAQLEWVRSRLADKKSLDVFDSILRFRASANLAYIEWFSENQNNQYFEPFLGLSEQGESFADIGCFDGRTSSDFIYRCPAYKAIYIFEPDSENLSMVRARFSKCRDIFCYPVGLGSKKGVVRFSSAGSNSAISESGNLEIQVETLDSFQLSEVTFLKMDIEGAELDALLGASDTIMQCHPRLAVSVYHRPSDLWRIPEAVLKVRDDYSIYLRHYTEGVTETVMFFMPRR